MKWASIFTVASVCLLGFASVGIPSPKPPKTGDSPAGSAPQSGSSVGITFSRGALPPKPPETKKPRQVWLLYDLIWIKDSSVQPYILQPRKDSTPIDNDHPLLEGDRLIVGVYPESKISQMNILMVSFNVTAQSASALNPAPVRPVFSPTSAGPASAGFEGGAPALPPFFLEWPYPLRGDTIPTVTVSALVSPESPRKAPPTPSPTPTPSVAGPSPTATPNANPEDQLITLLNITLPQVHQLYHYNVATGVAVSALRNPNFSRIQTAIGPPAQYATVKDSGSRTPAPLLFFTIYYPPMDAESPWHPRDLIPGFSVGLSLTSPSNSFFFGVSSEILRNVQFICGLNYAKVAELAPSGVDNPASSAAPVTQQKFHTKGFVGLTFNIDFIKGLFGGGKSGGA